MHHRGPTAGIVPAIVAGVALTLAACAPAYELGEGPGTADALARPAAEPSAESSILGIDLCLWLSPELSDRQVFFGVEEYAEPTQNLYQHADGRNVLRCEIQYDDLAGGSTKTLAAVTLMENGPTIDIAREETFEYRGVTGVITTLGRGVVQLSPTVTLAIESRDNDVLGLETVGYTGVLPLLRHMTGTWLDEKVPRTVDGSFAAASSFCESVDFRGWEDRIVAPDGYEIVRFARDNGVESTSRDPVNGIEYEGAIQCGFTTVRTPAWVWGSDNHWGHPGALFTFEQYPDAASAESVIAAHASSDHTPCVRLLRVGDDPGRCEDGSGMSGREATEGRWLAYAALRPSYQFTEEVAAEWAATADSTITANLPRIASNSVDPALFSLDPRYPALSSEDAAPAGLTCGSTQLPMEWLRSAHGVVQMCWDDLMSSAVSTGNIDGVSFTLDDTGCGGIDATKWGGESQGSVCVDRFTATVTSGQEGATVFREYFEESWWNPEFGLGD